MWNGVQRFSPSHFLVIVATKLAIHCHLFVYLFVCSPPLAQTVSGNRWGRTLNLVLLQKWSISNSICNETPSDPSAGRCCFVLFFSFPLGLHFRDCTLKIRQTPPQSAPNYPCQSCIPAIGHWRCKQSKPHESTQPRNICWVTADYESDGVEWYAKRSEDDPDCLSYIKKWGYSTNYSIFWDDLECKQIYAITSSNIC